MGRDLRDRVAIVTGASSGIGREVALAFAREGVRLALAARRQEKLRQVAEAVNKIQGEALVVPTDVSVRAGVERLVDATMGRFGRIDILVNNAGYGLFATVEETTIEDLRRILEVNFMGTFYCTKAVLPIMRQQTRGHIINVSSVAGKRSLPYSSGYCASKFAVVALSESLRMELDGSGINVSLVCPAGTATDFFEVAENRFDRHIHPVGPMQSATRVARSVVRMARHPKPEVITFKPARLMVVMNALAPSLVDWAMRRVMHRVRWGKSEQKKTSPEPDD